MRYYLLFIFYEINMRKAVYNSLSFFDFGIVLILSTATTKIYSLISSLNTQLN